MRHKLAQHGARFAKLRAPRVSGLRSSAARVQTEFAPEAKLWPTKPVDDFVADSAAPRVYHRLRCSEGTNPRSLNQGAWHVNMQSPSQNLYLLLRGHCGRCPVDIGHSAERGARASTERRRQRIQGWPLARIENRPDAAAKEFAMADAGRGPGGPLESAS